MSLCESLLNITIGVCLIEFNDFTHIKNNRAGGFLGQYIQKLFNSRSNKPFNCVLIGNSELGEKLKNNSYTGAIRQIQRKEMDFYFRQAPPFIGDNDFIKLTPVTNSENHLIGQILNEKSNLAILKKNIISSINSILKLNKNQKFFLLILSISFAIFSFNIMQIFLINIKTEKVIVDTSELLLNKERIFSSNLKLGWIKGEPDKDLIASSPNGTFLNKLYKYKNSNPPVIMDKSIDSLKNVEKMKSLFLFYNKFAIRTMAYVFNVMFNLKLFVNENNPLYSIPNHLYRIKEKSFKTQFIDKSLTELYEFGFLEKFVEDFDRLKLIKNKNNVQIYYSLNEYIEDHTLFESIHLNNLIYLFLIDLIFKVTILIISIANYIKRKRLIIKIKIKLFLN